MESKRRVDIDGLRGVAVILVLLFHFKNSARLPSGFVGVDVFFVISGFVVTLAMVHRHKDEDFPFLAEFFSRRVMRLIPPTAVVSIITVSFAKMVYLLDEFIKCAVLTFV